MSIHEQLMQALDSAANAGTDPSWVPISVRGNEQAERIYKRTHAYCVALTERAEAAERALVEAAIVLERLAIAVKWEIAPPIMEQIRFKVLPLVRRVLAASPGPNNAEKAEP
jgi:hypothetical protein